jgi:hypothetical protein
VTWDAIEVGDIITYRFEDKFPTRRVVEIDRDGGSIILRGDSIPGWPDFRVKRDDVLGRAAVRLRNGERLDRHGFHWRWAAYRAITTHRFQRLTVTARRIVRGELFRLAKAVGIR